MRIAWKRTAALRTEPLQGDAFQIYLTDAQDGLRAALLARCYYRAQEQPTAKYQLDCRLSIGAGSVTLLHPTSLAKSGGTAFEYSGRGLKAITRHGPQLLFASRAPSQARTLNVMLSLADELIQNWTTAQSQAVLQRLIYLDKNQEWLAGWLSIGRSAYNQRLRKAGWPALEELLSYYQEIISSSTT